jgi:8-oxo-dGTP diphosphatase
MVQDGRGPIRYAAQWLKRIMKECKVGKIKVIFDNEQVVKSFDAVVVVLFSSGKFVLVRNKERAWEFPGGHRERNESFEETAIREAREEAQAEFSNIEYLGYYITSTGHITMIVCADISSLPMIDDECVSIVGTFDKLPSPLSFGDGREQLFVDLARKHNSKPNK